MQTNFLFATFSLNLLIPLCIYLFFCFIKLLSIFHNIRNIGLCNFGASLCLWMATLHASLLIFQKLYSHLMHCSSEFYDITPKGRILDRCSNDINVLDLVIPMNIRMFMSTAFQVMKMFNSCYKLNWKNCIFKLRI